MKHFVFLLLLLLTFQRGHSQTPSITIPEPKSVKQLKEVDAQLSNPLSTNLITGAAYNRLVYQNQVAIGGSGIKEGRTIGANVTVDDKGGALNISTRPFKRKNDTKPPRIALQATVKGTAEEGLVSLFSGRDYQKTLGVGGGGLFFMPVPWAGFVYKERAKKDLQWKYRKMRAEEKVRWKDSYRPVMRPTWKDSSKAAVALFLSRWDSLQAKSWASKYYDDKLDAPDIDDAKNQAFMARYLDAEHAVQTLLPKDWDTEYPKAVDEKSWLEAFRNGVSTNSAKTKIFNDSLGVWWNREAETMRTASVKRYDSLQDSVKWEGLQFNWFSVSGLANTVSQPLFDSQAGSKGFVGSVRDNYWSGQIAYNWLRVGKKTNLYFTGGVTAAKQRVFKPADLKTYETISWQHTGTDSVRVVEQSKLYPLDPGQELVSSLQVGGTVYFHGATKFGLEALYAHEWGGPAKRNFTFGVFVPVKAADASVILMPLVRWDNRGEPHEWTVGISLTTSIPAFVKPKADK